MKTQHSSQSAQVESFEVDGLRVLLRTNPAQEVLALRLYLKGGSSTLPPAAAGLDSLWGRTARRGTRRFPKNRLNAELASMGAELGSAAGEDYDVFHLRCLRRHFERAWKVFTDVVQQPLLSEDDLEIVRHQKLMSLKQRHDNADGRLGEIASELAYRGHVYQTQPSGTLESVQSLTRQQVIERMQACLRRSNALLVVVGHLQRDELETHVRDGMQLLTQSGLQPVEPAPLSYEGSSLQVEQRELPTNYIMGQFSAPALRQADYAAALLAMSLLRDRLFEEVRTKRNLSYAPSAGLGNNFANLGWIYVTAVDPKATMSVILDEMRKLKESALTPKDLHDKVQVYITRYYLQNETHQAQAGFLASYELLGCGWKESFDFVKRLESLSPADIQAVAQKMLRNIQYAYLGNPDLADASVFIDP